MIVYYPNERFIKSLKEIYSTLDLEYKLYATFKKDHLEKLIDSNHKSVLLIPQGVISLKKVYKTVYISEKRDGNSIYIYQTARSFLKSINDYTKKDHEKNIINLLIPTGFNNDLKIISSVIKSLNTSGNRSMLVDTNPCRSLCDSNWDYLTKEIINKNLKLSLFPYIEEDAYYYIKPFNSFKDYYSNSSIYGKLLESLAKIDGLDYIFFLHYLNDYNSLYDIEKYSTLNLLMTYASSLERDINNTELDNRYSSKLLELSDSLEHIESKFTGSNFKVISTSNLWESIKIHYRDFELSIFEEVIRC